MTTPILVTEDVARRMANVAHDFHVDLDALTDAQFRALAIECGLAPAAREGS